MRKLPIHRKILFVAIVGFLLKRCIIHGFGIFDRIIELVLVVGVVAELILIAWRGKFSNDY